MSTSVLKRAGSSWTYTCPLTAAGVAGTYGCWVTLCESQELKFHLAISRRETRQLCREPASRGVVPTSCLKFWPSAAASSPRNPRALATRFKPALAATCACACSSCRIFDGPANTPLTTDRAKRVLALGLAAVMPPTEEEREASTLDVASQQIFAMLEAFPRFKDLAADAMRPADQAADVRGCILFTGPLKMLQTVAMVTQAGKASTAPERFKPLLSRCKWVAADAIMGELESDAAGTEGLVERLRAHDPSTQYVFVLAAQVASGGLCCKHHTGTGTPGIADFGPCKFVMDHGRERVDRMPGFNYAGACLYRLGLGLGLGLG